MDYTELNAKTIDKWAEEGWEWGIPISHEKFVDSGIQFSHTLE